MSPPPPLPDPEPGRALRVLTFNVQKLAGPAAPSTVVDGMLALAPDLMGLQEVFHGQLPGAWPDSRGPLEAHLEAAGFHCHWSPASGPGPLPGLAGGRWRDGLLTAARRSRFTMLESGEEVLSAGFFVRRITQHTTLSPVEGGPPLLFLNTHLSCGRHRRGSERRLSQARTTLEHVHHQELRHRPQATILVGDLNAPPASPEVELLAGGLLDTYRAAGPPQDPGWTLDPRNPLCRSWGSGWGETGRIDYVFLRPGQSPGPSLHVDSSQVVLREPDPASGLPLSDHYGVLSVLRWE